MESVDLIVDELNRCGLHVSANLGDEPGVGVKNTIILEIDEVNLVNFTPDAVSLEVGFILCWMQPYTVKVPKDIAKVCCAIEQTVGFEKAIKLVDIEVTSAEVEVKDEAVPDGMTYVITMYCSFVEDINTKDFMDVVK